MHEGLPFHSVFRRQQVSDEGQAGRASQGLGSVWAKGPLPEPVVVLPRVPAIAIAAASEAPPTVAVYTLPSLRARLALTPRAEVLAVQTRTDTYGFGLCFLPVVSGCSIFAQLQSAVSLALARAWLKAGLSSASENAR